MGEVLAKEKWPLLALMPDNSVSQCIPLVPFKLLPWCWSSEVVSLSKCMCGSLRGTAWGPNSFFHRLNPHWFLQPEVVGTYLPGTRTLGWGTWCGAGTPRSWDIPPKFLSTTCGCETSPSHVCTPPTSLDGCGFFNSIVVRLPFRSITENSEWLLFYILAVILMWLCKKVSHVCLCHHLDLKFLFLLSLSFSLPLLPSL